MDERSEQVNENMQNGKLIKGVQNIFGANSRITKAVKGYKKLQEVKEISEHFSTYLAPRIADTESLLATSYNIRHQVYCIEEGFEPPNTAEMEKDEFDAYSTCCLIEHRNNKKFAGTVRLVRPKEDAQLLPIEKYCKNSISDNQLHPRNFPRNEVCEISRLAVPNEFRRRQMDRYEGAGVGVINQQTYSEQELRCFPFIAIGLYLAAAAVSINSGVKHNYVMMEPRLARSMRFIGIKFEQIGPTVDYHGERAAFHITPEMLHKNLPKGFSMMYKNIDNTLFAK